MSADIKDDLQPYDDINVTPMLDLAYVLLVVFIILTTASVQGVRVESPVTQAANNLARPQTKAITITADGAVYLDAYPVTMEQLATSLAQMFVEVCGMSNIAAPLRSFRDHKGEVLAASRFGEAFGHAGGQFAHRMQETMILYAVTYRKDTNCSMKEYKRSDRSIPTWNIKVLMFHALLIVLERFPSARNWR